MLIECDLAFQFFFISILGTDFEKKTDLSEYINIIVYLYNQKY